MSEYKTAWEAREKACAGVEIQPSLARGDHNRIRELEAENERMQRVFVNALASLEKLPPGPWKTWTSCSYRRISRDTRDGGDGDVLCAVKHPDGWPDLSWNEQQCDALCELVNGLRAALESSDE